MEAEPRVKQRPRYSPQERSTFVAIIDESFDIWINIGKPPKYSPQERSTFGDMFANIDDNFDIWKTVENQYTRPIKSVVSY